MDFESKIISREISEILWETEKTVGTAESCTGGRIAEAIISVPGASKYFKGGIISYVNEIKERLLDVDPQVLLEKTAVCEEVAVAMVKGACRTRRFFCSHHYEILLALRLRDASEGEDAAGETGCPWRIKPLCPDRRRPFCKTGLQSWPYP